MRALIVLATCCCCLAAALATARDVDDERVSVDHVLKAVSGLKEENRRLRAVTEQTEAQLARLEEARRADDIAFMVSVTQQFNYTSGARVVFDEVVLSRSGGGWDAASDAFVCPVAGTYFFSLTVFGTQDVEFYTLLKRGSEVVTALRKDINTVNQVSTTAVVSCSQGQAVYAEAKTTGSQMGMVDRKTVFTGFLVQAD